MSLTGLISLDTKQVDRARALAERVTDVVQAHIDAHTTVGVERAVARLYGIEGYSSKRDGHAFPLANIVVDAIRQSGRLDQGLACWLAGATKSTGHSPARLAGDIASGKLDAASIRPCSPDETREVLSALTNAAMTRLASTRAEKAAKRARWGAGRTPLKYLIVATGNIFDDVVQAQAAVESGADIIAVIRSTAQSLLDYVPKGPTTTGFGGTWATQENFRVMREALNGMEERLGRYIRLTNYSSGLCMSEIAVMAAFENLDCLLNDSMYGILFRDINMKRTFVDQYFSRLICTASGIMIQTGEDNYLTTSESLEHFQQVLASQFINEAFAKRAFIPDDQMGLGHAFEADPNVENSLLMEIGQALAVRECFPKYPLKYMPPTRHMTGDIFMGHVYDTMFNLVTVWTDQPIELLGMMSEAIQNPMLMDRFISLNSARYVHNAARGLAKDLAFRPDGLVATRAHEVLAKAVELLEVVAREGLMPAIAKGTFAGMKRPEDGGRGLEGVMKKHDDYCNPLEEALERYGQSLPVRSTVS